MKNINLRCDKGQCIAMIGPNGCGKTTLIKSILGMVVPDAGSIIFNGENIKNKHQYRNQIGYMPQIGRYPDNMTIGHIINMIRDMRGETEKTDEDLLHAFDLPSLYEKRMRTLSGGTTQKVSATLAFLFNPDVLILDEPTAGLDPLATEILKEKIITEKEKGKLIFITSHQLSELDDLVTEVIFMQDGNIRFHKAVNDLLQSTGEQKIAKAIANILKNEISEQNS
ncbi:MAG: ABC transporter ATP-binding protein [Niabella sp.]